MSMTSTLRTGGRGRAVVAIVVLVVAVLAVVALRAVSSSPSHPSLRTATVKRANVSQVLQRSGTIEPVAQATVGFPISGTVSSVSVQAGQAVTTGQVLASLDTTSLQAALASKQAALASAQLTLDKALNGQSSSPSGSGGVATASFSGGGVVAIPVSDPVPGGGEGDVAAAAQAVAAGQQQLDAALNTATVALNQAAAACLGGDGGQATAANSACASALQASLQAQQQVQAATSEVAQQETTLATLLSSSSASSSAGSQSQQAQAPQASQSSGGSARTGSGGSASQSSAPTGAELVADQSAVDAAQAEVTAAQQNLAQATIVSPIDGTVAAVNLTGGAQVSAGSSFANVVVVGPGGFEVTTTVPVTEVGMVKLGDSASVVPDGTSQAFDGKVVSIGVSPTTSGTTTNYGVIVGLDGSPANLHNGASAAVAITVQQSNDALTVPTSAVRTAGGGAVHVVSVVSRGKTSPVPVQVGTIGSELTEIRSGLREGQEVMLADMTQPLPSATLPNRFGGFGGGLGGGFGGTFGGGGAGGTAVRGAGAGGRPGG